MRNIPQHLIDNPPIRNHRGLQLTEFVILGDQDTSYDEKFLKQNHITSILNTCGG